MKIFNWIVGSFCRTLGRFLFYIAIGILAMLIISGKVHAATVTPAGVTIGNKELPATLSASVNGSQYLLSATIDAPDYNYKYAVLTICANVGLDVSVYNTAYNYYFNDESYFSSTGKSCTTNGFAGVSYNLYLSVGQWDVGSGNTSLYRVSSYIKFKSTWGYNGYFTVQNFVFSNEDLSVNVQKEDEINSNLNTQINQNNTIIDQNQDIIDNQEQTNEKLDDLNDNLTSTEGADLGALQNSAGWLPAGPIDSILNLPLSLLNNLTTNLNKSCQPVILSIPYVNKDLTLPCVNTLYDDMGISGWVTTIGVIASAFIMFSYLLKLYKWVDDTLSFRENNQIDNWGGI